MEFSDDVRERKLTKQVNGVRYYCTISIHKNGGAYLLRVNETRLSGHSYGLASDPKTGSALPTLSPSRFVKADLNLETAIAYANQMFKEKTLQYAYTALPAGEDFSVED